MNMLAYSSASRVYARKIGDMDEGVVERRKNSGNTKHQLAVANLRAEGDVLLSGTGSFLGRHGDRFRGLSIWLVEIVAKISRNSNVCEVGGAPLSTELSTSAIFLMTRTFRFRASTISFFPQQIHLPPVSMQFDDL